MIVGEGGGDLIAPFVAGDSGVSADPSPFNIFPARRPQKVLPEIAIQDRLFVRGLPPLLLPAVDPLRDAVDDIARVRVDGSW